MELQLNTKFTPAYVKHHYCIDGMVKSVSKFRRSGELASVRISGKVYNSSSLYFNHLKFMVIIAKRKIEEEIKIDDECLELIPQLRTMQ